jgi:hypothetical protein
MPSTHTRKQYLATDRNELRYSLQYGSTLKTYAERKPDSKGQILYDSIYRECPEQTIQIDREQTLY